MTKKNTTEQTAPTPSAQGRENGIGSSDTHRDERKSATERKLVSRLQDAIDDNGRYSYKLKDLSVGYAVGRGVTENEAKTEISELFKKEMGVDLKSYLEENRLENGLSIDSGRGGR